MARRSVVERKTLESSIVVSLELDGSGVYDIATGLPFFDHMLAQLARHSGMNLTVTAKGDIEVDSHHVVEDVGITLGRAFSEALGDKSGISRFGAALVPMDETLVEVVLDLSGRAYLHYEVDIVGASPLGMPSFEPQLAEEFFRAFAHDGLVTLHVNLRYGKNTHHVIEAVFKAVARAIRQAKEVVGGPLPSTKGTL